MEMSVVLSVIKWKSLGGAKPVEFSKSRIVASITAINL
jgi:hypothetical protein